MRTFLGVCIPSMKAIQVVFLSLIFHTMLQLHRVHTCGLGFSRYCQIALQSGRRDLHSCQQCVGIPVGLHLLPWFCHTFWILLIQELFGGFSLSFLGWSEGLSMCSAGEVDHPSRCHLTCTVCPILWYFYIGLSVFYYSSLHILNVIPHLFSLLPIFSPSLWSVF